MSEKINKFVPWGMSGWLRCQICGAILPGKISHECVAPGGGYVLRDGMWTEEN